MTYFPPDYFGPSAAAGAPAPPGWLVATADVAAARGDAFASNPAIPLLIGAASRAVEDHCNRTFAYSSNLDEYYDGAGRPRIFLRRPPVASITSVTIDGQALDNSANSAWTVDPPAGILLRGPGSGILGSPLAWTPGGIAPWAWLGLGWPIGVQNVRVRYAGGFATIPDPVKLATIIMVKHLSDAMKNTGIYTAERIGDYEYQMAQAPPAKLPFAAAMLLGPYSLPKVG